MKKQVMRVYLYVLLVILLVIINGPVILAQDNTSATGKIELTALYTKLEGKSGSSFEFELTLNYQGSEAQVFNLSATGPKDWTTYITPSYPKDKQIKDIRLEPGATYNNTISVYTAPPSWLTPEPGEYQVIVEASSGGIKGSIQLTAVVTAVYTLTLTTPSGLLNTHVTAGKDNYFTLEVRNSGSAPIDNINFSSSKPGEWNITFTPDKIDSLEAGASKTIDVTIKPPSKTIAGDYQVTITASGKQARDNIDIRVTVETPTVWGWVGVGIILLVVAGLVFVFWRFGRR